MLIPKAIDLAQAPPMTIPAIAPPDKDFRLCFNRVDAIDAEVDLCTSLPGAVKAVRDGIVHVLDDFGRAVQNLLHVPAQLFESPTGAEPVKGLV